MKKIIKSYKGLGEQRVLIISGIHGNELTSLQTSIEANHFAHELEKLTSQLTFVIGYSEEAIKADVRGIDFDANRSIADSPEMEDLRKLITEHDIIIDLHTSWECSTFILIDNDKHANKILNWCITSKVPYLLRDFPGDGMTIKRYALSKGKIGITFEMQGMQKIDLIQSSVLIEYIKLLLQNKLELTENKNYKLKNAYEIVSPVEGLIKRFHDMGEFIESGEIIAIIYDYNMKKLAEIKMEESGFLLVASGRDFINQDEVLFNIQPIIG